MPRRILEGNVVSAKADKTITVVVERRYMHPMYKKYINSTSKYNAHDESNAIKEGERVSIIECRPISKTKCWTVVTGDGVDAKKPAPKKAAEAKKEDKKPVPKKAAEAKKEDKKAAAPKKAAAVKKSSAKKTKSTKKDA